MQAPDFKDRDLFTNYRVFERHIKIIIRPGMKNVHIVKKNAKA